MSNLSSIKGFNGKTLEEQRAEIECSRKEFKTNHPYGILQTTTGERRVNFMTFCKYDEEGIRLNRVIVHTYNKNTTEGACTDEKFVAIEYEKFNNAKWNIFYTYGPVNDVDFVDNLDKIFDL